MTETTEAVAPAPPSAPAASETAPTAAEAALATQQTTTAEPAKPVPQTTADEGDDGEGGETTGKKASRSQRLQRKVQLLTAELDSVRRQPEARPAQDAPAQRSDATEEKPPQEKDFNGDYLAFERALNAFNVERATEKAVLKIAERERAQRTASQQAEVRRESVIAHIERVEDLKERVADFDTVMKDAAGINLRDEVAAEILGSEKSALIQYHLAKNPDKARDLNGLTGRELARAVGRLEGAVRLPAAKRATDATPPVLPLGGGGAAPSFDPARAEMGDYAANYRQRQAARDKQRFG